MTAQQLADLLRAQAGPAPHLIELNDQTLGTSGLDALVEADLVRAGGTLKLLIDPATIPAQPPAAGFTLAAQVPAGGAGFLALDGRDCSLQFLVGSTVDLVLTINTRLAQGQPVPWVLSDSFPELKYLPYDDLTLTNPQLVFSTGAAGTPPKGLNFDGVLTLGDIFALIADLLHTSAEYPLAGTFARGASGLAFDLQAPFNVAPLTLANIITLEDPCAGVALIPVVGQSEATTLTAFYLGATVQFENNSGTKLPFQLRAQMPLNLTKIGNLAVSVLPAPGFQTSLDRLGSLIGGQSWDDFFNGPAQALKPYFANFGLLSYSASFALSNQGVSAIGMSLQVGTLQPWPLWNDYTLTLKANWSVLFLGDDALSTLQLAADFNFKTITFAVTVTVPNLVITGQQSGGPLSYSLDQLNKDVFDGALALPPGLLTVSVANFGIEIDVNSKRLTVSAVANLSIAPFGTNLLALHDMAISVQIDGSGPQNIYSADLGGQIQLGPIIAQTTAHVSNDPKDDTTFSIHLVNETVGTMLNHLVHLVDPTFDLKFEEPWQKLLDISLDALVLNVTLPGKESKSKQTISLTYNTSIDLGFIDIKGISLTYTKDAASGGSVQIQLEGTFLGQAFGTGSANPPLGWDAINDKPPSVPGKGDKVFDLQYAGLGQHIAFPDPQPQTIAAVMKALHDSVTPVQAGELPDFGGKSLVFSQDSNWLIGAQFSVLDTVAISAIFNDPNLYGILIQLSGEKAKIFAGLSFEILYRKISDNLGVYHIELKLPDAMRNLQFGEVSVTLPIVVLDIYTNGNFRVDFGFPKGTDFSNSFALQVFPFVGYGGFYFALLDGSTSTRVPKISNGTFAPVIEFGVALSIGVGKTVDEGILSGGITVTVIGILQGVLAWFNPTQPATKETYYWFQGSISIVGKLYATINFAIISASLDVTAYATVTLTIEAHQPIYIELSAGVSVRLSVKILFFTIHFSFSATVHASFTIGHATPTPWILADGSGNGSHGALRQLRGQETLHSTVLRHVGYTRALRSARIAALLAETPPLINWPALLVLPQVETVTLRVLPSFTKSEKNAQGVDAVLLLTAENSIDPQAVTLNEHKVLFGDAPEMAAFNLLMEGMLRWAIQAQTNQQASVTADALEILQQQLKNPDTVAAAFDYTTLTNFLKANFVFNVTTAAQWAIASAARKDNQVTLTTATPHGLANGDAISVNGVADGSFNGSFTLTSASGTTLVYTQTGPDAQSSGGTVSETSGVTFFPMIPAIKLTDNAGTAVDFGSFNGVDENYQAKAVAYFQLLQTQFQQRNNTTNNAEELSDPPPVSLATVIFAHYFNMLMSAGVKAALDLLHSYAYATPENEPQSLGEIAQALDPSLLTDPLRIVSPNQDKKVLAPGALFNLPNVVRQVRSGDTPASLADLFAKAGALNASEQQYTATDLLAANAGAAGIFTPGLSLTLNGLNYTTQPNETLNLIAVRLLLRAASPAIVNSVLGLGPVVTALQQLNPGLAANQPLATYIAPAGAMRANGVSTITTLMPHGLVSGAPVTITGVGDPSFNGTVTVGEVPTPLSFTFTQTGLPAAQSGGGVAAYRQTITITADTVYTVVPGDTLTLIAAYPLALTQGLFNVVSLVSQTQQLNPSLPSDPTQTLAPGTIIQWPSLTHVLAAGDSINSLATALLTTPAEMQNNLLAVPASTQLLAPQAVLHAPMQYQVQAADTFSGIAANFDLSLAEVATQAVYVSGLFAAKQTLTISDLPQIAVDTLLAGLLNQAEWNNAAGQVSRFLLAGLRLPDPNDKYFQGLSLADMANPAKLGKIKTLPLYQLTGQQYALSTSNLGAYQITLNNQASVNWLKFGGASSATFGLTADQQALVSTIAQSAITPNVQTLTRLALYQMTPPRLALQNHIAWQAAALPSGCLSGGGVAGNPSLWLFPEALVQQISATSAQNQTALLYELIAAKHHDPSQPVTAAEAGCYAWATLVDIEIALPATDQPTPAVANAYVINGTDDTGAALLQQVQQYLSQQQRTLNIAENGAVRASGATPVTTLTTVAPHGLKPGAHISIDGVQDASFNGFFTVASVPSSTTLTYAQPDTTAATSTGGQVTVTGAALYLLYSPNPTSGNPSGLASAQLNAAASYLLKTNLSTLTHSGGEDFATYATVDPTDVYAAPLGQAADFVALLWEASITRSGGFYLNYVNQDGNAALPASVFGTATTATLSLLVLLDAQAEDKDATLQPFNNCVIVGDNIDTATTTLFVQPAIYTVVAGDSLTSATANFNQTWSTNYPVLDVAGFNQAVPLLLQVGAELALPNKPDYTIQYGDTLASIVKAQLPGGSLQDLLNAGANATSPILATGAAMQFANGILQPTATVPQGTLGFELTRTAPDPDRDVVDTLFNLTGYTIEAAGPFLQSGAGLPTTPADSWQAQTDGLTLRALHDETPSQWYYQQTLVVSQFVAQPPGSTSPALPPAQTNPYNGIGAGDQLNDVTLRLQLQDIFGNTPPAAALPALTVPVGYFDTLSSLAAWPSLAVSYVVTGANGAPQLALNLTMQEARYIPAAATPVAAAQAAIKADLASYQSLYYQLAQPDVSFALQTSLDAQTPSYPLDKTPFFAFAYSAYVYLAALAALQEVTPTLAGTTTVGDLWQQFGVTAAQLFEANQNTLVNRLFAATPTLGALVVPQVYATVQSDSLQSIVNDPRWKSFNLTVPGLAALNQAVPLGVGVDLAAPAARTVVASATDSLNAVAQRAHAAVAALALANATQPGYWRQGAVLTVGTQQYTLGANDTLNNAAQQLNATVEAVATANQWLTNLFAGDVTLQVNDLLIGAGDTFASLAQLVGSDVGTLATINASVPNLFAPTTEIQLGAIAQAPPPQPDETLAGYAGRVQVTLAQLAQANLATAFVNGAQPLIPGVLQPGNAPSYSTYVAAADDTLASIAAKFGTDPATLTALNQGLPDLLAGDNVVAGSRWICPPMQGGAFGVNKEDTLAGLATAYNILTPAGVPDVVTLAEANAATLGVLAAEVELPQWKLTTGANETFNSLVNRLAAANVLTSANTAYTVSDLAQALADTLNLINPQAQVTPVPPAALNSNGVTVTPHFTQAVFPLTVNVSTARDARFVDPDFAHVTAVAQAVTSIRPEPDSGANSGAFTFNQFASALQTALDGVSVATGAPLAEGEGADASTFWAVNLGNAAGPQLSYQFEGGQTQYFALPPLSTSLLGGTVNIIPYVSGQTPPFTDPAQPQTFQAVDLDVWLNTFLQSIDLFLSPAYAVPAYALDVQNATAVIQHKRSLAQKLAQRVTWVLQRQQPLSLPHALDDAQAALQQALLTQLSNAFTVDTLVQVPVTVVSSTTDAAAAPRLSGKLSLAGAQASQQLPDAFSFSTAKVSLTDGAATATFLFSVKAPASYKDAPLDLQYNVTELELPDPHARIGDYEGSSWLKFIQPLSVKCGASSSLIGSVDIPIPLRAYPSPVTLLTQSAQQSVPLPSQAEDLRQWDFGFAYQHDDAQQDTPLVSVTFNASPQNNAPTGAAADVNVQAIFEALAKFMAVYPALKNDLALLPLWRPGAAATSATAAVAAFRQLVAQVDEAWKPQARPLQATPSDTFNYQLQKQQTDTIPAQLQTLTLAAVDPVTGQSQPNPSQLWPAVFIRYAGQEYQLHQTLAVAEQAVYQYPDDPQIPADTALAQRFVYGVNGGNQTGSWAIAAASASGAVRTNGIATITTTAPHGLNPGARVEIVGVADASFNGAFAVATVPSATQFTYVQSGNPPDAMSGGGTATESLLPAGLTLSGPQSFLFCAADIFARQNGRAGVAITRNFSLVETPTNPAFVYRTPLVNFPSPTAPSVNAANTLLLPNQGEGVAGALGAFFQALFQGQSAKLTIRLAAAYAYPLAQTGATALNPLVPIALVPSYSFDSATDANPQLSGSFVSQMQGVLQTWAGQRRPLPAGGSYFFDLTVYASDSQLQPLIHAASLQYKLGLHE